MKKRIKFIIPCFFLCLLDVSGVESNTITDEQKEQILQGAAPGDVLSPDQIQAINEETARKARERPSGVRLFDSVSTCWADIQKVSQQSEAFLRSQEASGFQFRLMNSRKRRVWERMDKFLLVGGKSKLMEGLVMDGKTSTTLELLIEERLFLYEQKQILGKALLSRFFIENSSKIEEQLRGVVIKKDGG